MQRATDVVLPQRFADVIDTLDRAWFLYRPRFVRSVGLTAIANVPLGISWLLNIDSEGSPWMTFLLCAAASSIVLLRIARSICGAAPKRRSFSAHLLDMIVFTLLIGFLLVGSSFLMNIFSEILNHIDWHFHVQYWPLDEAIFICCLPIMVLPVLLVQAFITLAPYDMLTRQVSVFQGISRSCRLVSRSYLPTLMLLLLSISFFSLGFLIVGAFVIFIPGISEEFRTFIRFMGSLVLVYPYQIGVHALWYQKWYAPAPDMVA